MGPQNSENSEIQNQPRQDSKWRTTLQSGTCGGPDFHFHGRPVVATCLSRHTGAATHNHLECCSTINHKETKFEQKSEKNRLAEAAMFYKKNPSTKSYSLSVKCQ